MPMPSPPASWMPHLGRQRDWIWRGWQVRYTYAPSAQANALPILLIHGFGSSLTQWHCNILPLAEHHPVYAVDMLGFGASRKAAAPYNVQLWVDQVYDLWRSLLGRPVLLVGHSLGALVALSAAAQHPEMVQGLTLMTLPASRQELIPPWVQPIAGTLERLFANPLVVLPLFELVRRPRFIRAGLGLAYAQKACITQDLIESYVAPTRDRGAGQTLCRLSSASTHYDYAPNADQLINQLRCPTLLLWGQQDRVIPLKRGRQLVQQHPSLKLIELPQAGHCAYEEQPDRVNQELLQWAAQVKI
ncbi:MAG: alpha/beta fold hydrolase [Leptolyngbya sp. DLM2.Bin15]|nr:MAG: alpha/beta fold hydrolase [Leptolyngbya sp. DLM2.Bin15]